jgi:hypothetical protein
MSDTRDFLLRGSRVTIALQIEQRGVACGAKEWYTIGMTDFGKGPTLAQANLWLRNDAERIERILDVTERNSVIEGLPPLSAEIRERLRKELTAGSALAQAPGG